MRVETLTEPFPHILFEDFCSGEELNHVLYELRALSLVALPPEKTGGAWTEDAGQLKKNSGMFLCDVYRDQNVSSIYRVSRKLFDKSFMEVVEASNLVFKYLSNTNEDDVLVQFYENGSYYKKHTDFALYTSIIKIDSPDKAYEGGDLTFPDYGYSIELKHNSGVLFPSFVPHEVTPVKLSSNDPLRGRITIAVFSSLSIAKYSEASRRAHEMRLREMR